MWRRHLNLFKMRLYIGADHNGFKLKEKLKVFLHKYGCSVEDLGGTEYEPSDDYPIYAAAVGRHVVKDRGSFGILICGSGQGVCIAANKIKGVRAALCENIRDAKSSRNDDDCNVLCLQGSYLYFFKAKKLVRTFLETPFANEPRFVRRLNELKKLEKSC
jgi:ribose 5-phosphate isomerase B